MPTWSSWPASCSASRTGRSSPRTDSVSTSTGRRSMLARGRVESGAERIRRRRRPAFVAIGLAALAAAGCGERDGAGPRGLADASAQAQIERTLELHRERIESRADSIDRVFKPLPLLTAAQEAALRRYGNDAHLARARRYG